jgi:ParB-like chromosome segregation protein Spo0J
MQDKKLQVDYVPISEIVPYDKNPRKNDRAVDIVAKSISQFGFNVPILLDRNNIIIAGHTRLKAAVKLGLQEVPVIWIDYLTEEQVKAFRIMDNKSTEYAEWDWELLKGEFEELKNLDLNLDFTGFSEKEINNVLASNNKREDYIPTQIKYNISPGDTYQLGNHLLLCV